MTLNIHFDIWSSNTVFRSSFLFTFPMAFLGITDRILKWSSETHTLRRVILT